jgi:hypothetical protein
MPWKLLLGPRDEGTPLGLAPQVVLSVKSPIHCMELAYGQNFLNATPPNKPLEWTGRRQACFDSNSFLPATQGQRSACARRVPLAPQHELKGLRF